ncbi:MAG TPA: hypothetical protein VFM25_08105 [Verrucomicrobiae bacterium]|nr:hypothetical protein [Verrucomicrobiae bacterium]
MMKKPIRAILFAFSLFSGAVFPVQAQWLTQSVLVKPGWTAIYLHVDASYKNLNELVGSEAKNPIDQIWRWQPPASAQFVTSPLEPLTTSSDWANWSRFDTGVPATLSALTANSAYLVHSTATSNYVWQIKGKPIAPSYIWTTSGLNFFGFPTPPDNPPLLDNFLSLVPEFSGAAEFYQYVGGNLGGSNPGQVIARHALHVTRGQAFWVRAGTYFNDYFGPFQVSLSGSGEIALGDSGGQYSFHLRNTTATNLTVSVRLISSETPPTGQPAIAGAPPVLLRGALNITNLTYAYSDLSGGVAQWNLAPKGQPGSDITVVLGVNRSVLIGNPGKLYAGILRFTDSYGFSQVDVPVSAQASSLSGLWVGKAVITQVANYLKTYDRDANNKPIVSPDGNYIVTNVDTSLGPVAKPFPFRLILHNDGTNVVLLQRVYYGVNPFSKQVISTSESALDPAKLDSARRISAVNFPWSSANNPWPFSGQLAAGNTLTTTVALAYDDQASNPFLHTYHPDHDNLDATFKNELPRGAESYDITRQITLQIDPVGDDFGSLTHVGQTFSGTYSETIVLAGSGSNSRTFNVSGNFSINRISSIATLTRP